MTLHGGNGAMLDRTMASRQGSSTGGGGGLVASPTSLIQWNSLQQQNAEQVDLSKLLESIRATLRNGGIMAWVNLGLNLERSFTQSENAGLGKGGVKRVFNESNVMISDVDARAIVRHIANDDHGKVSPDVIKNFICGALTGRRLDLVQSVFEALDRKQLGYISFPDIVAAHDAAKHPSVMFGEKSAEQIQDEFQRSFQTATRHVGTNFVNLYQWMSYFQYIYGHVPSDEYFELLMKRVWKATSCTSLSEATAGTSSAANFGSGYPNDSVTFSQGAEGLAPMTLMQALQESNPATASAYSKTPLSISTGALHPPPIPSRLHRLTNSTGNGSTSSGGAGQASMADGISPRAAHTTNEFLKGAQFAACMVDPSMRQPSSGSNSVSSLRRTTGASPLASFSVRPAVDAGTTSVLNRMRTTIKERGLRGLVELSRNIRLSDEDNDGFLTLSEFKRAVLTLESVRLSDVDLRCLFSYLDTDRRGLVALHAVLGMIREPMNYHRFQLAQAAFQSIDRDRSGQLDPSEIVQAYDASKHPEVISGRKAEEDVFHEFLESFDVESSSSDIASGGKISFQQWEQYYQNVSFFVADDDFFDLMIRNTWHLTNLQLEDDLCYQSNANGEAAPSSPRATTTFGTSNGNFRVVRGSGHGSSQAFAILQPDLSDHLYHPLTGMSHPGGNPGSSTPGVPGSMFAAAKQTKELRRIIAQLRVALKDQGVVGFISLQRKFRLMDDDQNGSISLHEFQRALKETKLHLAPADVTSLFQYFDANHDGAVDFTEFLSGIREPMNDRRMLFVRMAFDIIDKDNNGVLEVSDIVDVYDARKHPEVISGRKTEHDVFQEFIETFDIDQLHDGKVTFDEWTRYYANISASIDDDDYFELMMRNAWHISGGHGWSANSSNRRVLVTHADGSASVEEVRDDIGVKKEDVVRVLAKQLGQVGQQQQVVKTTFYDVLDHTSAASRTSSSVAAGLTARRTRGNTSDSISACLTMNTPSTKAASSTGGTVGGSGNGGDLQLRRGSVSATVAAGAGTGSSATSQDNNDFNNKREHPVGVQLIISKLKAGLKAKGAHGFCGLSRKFRIMDDDGNGSLNVSEFRKAMSEMELELSDADARLLFQYFDRDRSGSINLNEFLAGVRDPLNERRVFFVREAFQLMDKDGNGLLEPSDIVEAYDASRHPDVLSGRKSAELVCREFLETFDVDGVHNGKITWDQWLHYYQNISASIDDDGYFELMMRNAWHISGGAGWCANSSNRRVLVTLADGTDVVREVQNDLGVKVQDVHMRLQAQDRQQQQQQEDTSSSSSVSRIVSMTGSSLNLTDPPAAKRILTLREVSSAAPMEMSQQTSTSSGHHHHSASSSSSTTQGDVVFHTIRHRIRQKRVADIVALRKRTLQYIDAKTATISALHCSECLSATLGLTLTEENCVALFGYMNQLPEAREFDQHSHTTGKTSSSINTNSNTIGSRFVQSSQASLSRMALRKLFHCILGPLSPPCADAARRVFTSLANAGKGRVFPATLAKSFQAQQHPDVRLGGASPAAVFQEFAANFEISGGSRDSDNGSGGAVDFEHFKAYCVNLRATLGSDELLQILLRDCFVA